MNFKLKIGAPSLTGKGAPEEVEAAIGSMEFPCVLRVANHMPRAAVFPESGIELASAFRKLRSVGRGEIRLCYCPQAPAAQCVAGR